MSASSASGTLNILDGGRVTNNLAVFDGAMTVTVSGTGSTWTNTGSLYLGNSGSAQGVLNILSGGQVSNTDCYLGHYSPSSGTAIVTGPGSTWINAGNLYASSSATGKLTVSDG